MKIAIVGSEESKFTPAGKQRAVDYMIRLLSAFLEEHGTRFTVVSGGCHLGGIDIWAEDVADYLGLEKEIYKPRSLSWSGGYKERNILIAQNCDQLRVISVDKLPANYNGMKFDYCYHCAGKNRPSHVKSGACWTANKAIALGKPAFWYVVRN